MHNNTGLGEKEAKLELLIMGALPKAVPVAFIDVDTQKDFIMPYGCLSIPGSECIIDNLAKLNSYASNHCVLWIATMDSHVLEDEEISSEPDFKDTFPPHCMNGTAGEERIAATLRSTPLILDVQTEPLEKLWSFLEGCYDSVVFKKNNFDIFSNKNLDQFLSLSPPHVFVVFGVATDFCVKYAVEGLLHRNFKVIVVKDAVFAIDQEAEKQLFDQWQKEGVKLLETKEVMNLNPDEFEQLFS